MAELHSDPARLLARGRLLEIITLAWNVVGILVLAGAAIRAGSIALGGFALDSLIEIGASTVVLWELADARQLRQERALRLIGLVARQLEGTTRSPVAWDQVLRPISVDTEMMAPA